MLRAQFRIINSAINGAIKLPAAINGVAAAARVSKTINNNLLLRCTACSTSRYEFRDAAKFAIGAIVTWSIEE